MQQTDCSSCICRACNRRSSLQCRSCPHCGGCALGWCGNSTEEEPVRLSFWQRLLACWRAS